MVGTVAGVGGGGATPGDCMPKSEGGGVGVVVRMLAGVKPRSLDGFPDGVGLAKTDELPNALGLAIGAAPFAGAVPASAAGLVVDGDPAGVPIARPEFGVAAELVRAAIAGAGGVVELTALGVAQDPPWHNERPC